MQYLFFHEALLNNARHTVGIALSDLIQALKTPPPTQEKIENVMTAPVVAVDEDAKIREIARLLDTHRIKRVPVLRGGRMVGIVSRADLVRAMAT